MIVGHDLHFITNVSDEPNIKFKMAVDEYLAAMRLGPICAVLHSHTNGNCGVSHGDMSAQQTAGNLWGVLVLSDSGAFKEFNWFGDCAPVAPLVGRTFRHGIWDCYSLIRDWFWLERDVIVGDRPRHDQWWLMQDHDNFYDALFTELGFAKVDRRAVQIGDCITYAIYPGGHEGARVSNHAAIVTAPNTVLHHLWSDPRRGQQRLSKHDLLSTWDKMSVNVLRYTG